MTSEATSTPFSFADGLEDLLPELRAFARSLCRNPALADDLVQDACLKAWSAVDRFDPSQPMRPWLFRILRNEYYQYTRRSWRSVGGEPEMFEETLVDPGCIESQLDLGRMNDAIYSLPIAQRDALILVVAGGFTYEEAGEVCGCAAGTIKSRVSRARAAVQAMFDAPTGTTAEKDDGKTGVAAHASANPIDRLCDHIDTLLQAPIAA